MYNTKSLLIIITFIILLGLTGCNPKENKLLAADKKILNGITTDGNSINLNDFKIIYPVGWTKRGNEKEIFFDNENKITIGGISLVGHYGSYETSLPNHSEVLNSEHIETALGKGRLFTLERDYPAAEKNSETWTEIHAIIPISKENLAYDIWVKGTKDTLLSILKSIH